MYEVFKYTILFLMVWVIVVSPILRRGNIDKCIGDFFIGLITCTILFMTFFMFYKVK